MKTTYRLANILALLLTLAVVLSGCSAVGELIKPYEQELGELGEALLDQVIDAGKDYVGELADSTGPPSTASPLTTTEPTTVPETEALLDRDGSYTSKDDVAAYLAAYGELPDNFITKAEARDLGWDSSAGNLHKVAPGKSIGGDKFGNYEELLPKKSGRQYYECDIDYTGGHRNAKRIVFSNDGLIFYTDDHYETFKELTP